MLTKRKLLITFFSENKLTMSLAFVVSLLSNLLTIIIPVSIGKFYNLVFGLKGQRSQILNFLPDWLWNTSSKFLLFFISLVALKIILDFIQRYQVANIGEKMILGLRKKLFNAQLNMPMQVYDEKGIGKYLLRHSGDLKSIKNYMTKGLIGFGVDMILLTLVILAIGMLDNGLLWIMLSFLSIFAALILLMNKKLREKSLAQRNTKSGLLSYVNSTLRTILSIKVFNRQTPESNRYAKRSEKVYGAGVQYNRIHSIVMAVIPGLFYVLLFAVLFYTNYHQTAGNGIIDASALLTAILLLITAKPVFRRVMRVHTIWELGNISFKKLLLILNQPGEISAGNSELNLKDGSIEIEGLEYKYPGSKHRLSFDQINIEPKKISLIRGGASSGKTTLVKLLSGIYSSSNGQVLIDGQDLSNISRKSLRKSMSVVPEGWPLYGRTVFQAISYSRNAEKKSRASMVLDLVQEKVPEHLKLTLDTKIGDLGSNLSQGQIKLVCYARALLTDKSILIIDEPFSGLDEISALHIAQIINELQGSKTIIVLSQESQGELLNIDRAFILGRPLDEFVNMKDTYRRQTKI